MKNEISPAAARLAGPLGGLLLYMKPILPIVIICSLLLNSCLTYVAYLGGPLRARVVDAVSGAPIANVVVTMCSTDRPDICETGKSDDDGVVELPILKGRIWSGFPFVMDRVLRPNIVRFEAKGYVSKEISATESNGGEEPIKLKPTTNNGSDR